MTDRPIIMSAPMVRALLEGRKTQHRELAWRAGTVVGDGFVNADGEHSTVWQRVRPGDRLWVRETWAALWPAGCDDGRIYDDPHSAVGRPVMLEECEIVYKADTGDSRPGGWPDGDAEAPRWRPSTQMHRSASRITLDVTAVRMERLQDITEEDARAEGAVFHDGHGVGASGWRHDGDDGYVFSTAKHSYGRLWSKLHGPDSWSANPEVVAMTFTVRIGNIDATLPPPPPR